MIVEAAKSGDFEKLVRIPVFWVFISFLLFIATLILYFSLTNSSAIEKSVFRIIAQKTIGLSTGTSSGSGFLVSGDNIIVTNEHVIEGASNIQVRFVEDEELVSRGARVLWQDKKQDLAILKTARPLRGSPLSLANIDQDNLSKGDDVTAIGFPGAADNLARYIGIDGIDPTEGTSILYDPSVSTGTVQRHVEAVYRLMIQHSADIHKGNSGGPLFDSCWRVVGVNTLGEPGETLEAAVHSQEVIQALKDEGVSYTTSSGTCIAGLARGGQMSLLLMFVLVLSSLFMAINTYYGSPSNALAHYTRLFRTGANVPAPRGGSVTSSTGVTLVGQNGGGTISISEKKLNRQAKGIVLGRSGSDVDISLVDASVSRKHASIYYSAIRGIEIEDMHSSNGTILNGVRLQPGKKTAINNNDKLVFGQLEFVVRTSSTGQSDASRFTQVDDRTVNHTKAGQHMTQQSLSNRWMLSGFDSNGKVIQQKIAVPTKPGAKATKVCSIGRSVSNDFSIQDNSISRKHAELLYSNDTGLMIVDKGSSNGTFVDGKKVGDKPVKLDNVRNIKLGDVTLSYSKIE